MAIFRFSGIATHFVPSSRLEALESRLSEIDEPNHDLVHNTIEEFAVETGHTPQIYTLHGEDRLIVDKCFKYNTVEEIVKALKEDGSRFALDTVNTMLKRSPTSLKVTLEHLRKGSKLSIKDCLRMEHVLWQTVPVSQLIIILPYKIYINHLHSFLMILLKVLLLMLFIKSLLDGTLKSLRIWIYMMTLESNFSMRTLKDNSISVPKTIITYILSADTPYLQKKRFWTSNCRKI
jgi:hypothetical protein